MKIHVRFFGPAKTATGSSEAFLEVPPGPVHTLRTQLWARFPALEKTTFRLAQNHEFLAEEDALLDQAIIDVIPPVSGG
jgi:molybdopterin converting factor small subunit